jgi:cytochrome c551/c552
MKTLLIAVAAASAVAVSGAAYAASGADLFKEKKCERCHAPEEKKKGPSLKEIADKKNDPAKIAAKLKEGLEKHPKVNASDEEIKAMIVYTQTGK